MEESMRKSLDALWDWLATNSKNTILLRVTFPLLAITLALLLVIGLLAIRGNYYAQRTAQQARVATAAESDASSGTDFRVQGRRVRADFEIAPEVLPSDAPGQPGDAIPKLQRGDSVPVVLRLKDLQGNTVSCDGGSNDGLADECNGGLKPTLSVGDCQVTPSSADSISSSQPLPAFVWVWSIDGCQTTGFKAVQVLLSFDGHSGTSDPVAFRGLAFFTINDPLSIEQAGQLLTAASTVLTIVSLVAAFFQKRSEGGAPD
jgi:hypothetical protein